VPNHKKELFMKKMTIVLIACLALGATQSFAKGGGRGKQQQKKQVQKRNCKQQQKKNCSGCGENQQKKQNRKQEERDLENKLNSTSE
jgi:uncharacterized protein HemX